MKNIFHPDYYYPDIFAIDPLRLRHHGIRLLILDMDNTLINARRMDIPDRVKDYVNRIRSAGITPVVMSNNVSSITERRCMQLHIDFFSFSLKPLPFGYKRVLAKYGEKPEHTAVIGDQIFTDIAGGRIMGIMSILVDPLTNENNIFGKGVRLISDTLRLFKGVPEKGEYYGKL